MPTRIRFSLATVLLTITCCALAIGWWATMLWRQEPVSTSQHLPSSAAIRELPMTISASEVGDFANGYSWYLSVNSAGLAALTIENRRKSGLPQFRIDTNELSMLRERLIFHDFFRLADDYGEIVPDGSTRTITITVGDFTKTVRLHYLGNWLKSDTAKLRQPATVLNIWNQLRGWVQHSEAVDTRRHDEMVLNAVRGRNTPKQRPK